jgi:hypothetical protein
MSISSCLPGNFLTSFGHVGLKAQLRIPFYGCVDLDLAALASRGGRTVCPVRCPYGARYGPRYGARALSIRFP